ncbi:MAG: hypothetical protein COS89_00610 [Deltaproteobacteria bacterium CG07_land_8_20_14_0_80_38_7]|nr:MAG: hypothetical protein COS89_00610 [Deltaproteobacteria bacterium CG07_land_8_20_14_0_80_38_7]
MRESNAPQESVADIKKEKPRREKVGPARARRKKEVWGLALKDQVECNPIIYGGELPHRREFRQTKKTFTHFHIPPCARSLKKPCKASLSTKKASPNK